MGSLELPYAKFVLCVKRPSFVQDLGHYPKLYRLLHLPRNRSIMIFNFPQPENNLICVGFRSQPIFPSIIAALRYGLRAYVSWSLRQLILVPLSLFRRGETWRQWHQDAPWCWYTYRTVYWLIFWVVDTYSIHAAYGIARLDWYQVWLLWLLAQSIWNLQNHRV